MSAMQLTRRRAMLGSGCCLCGLTARHASAQPGEAPCADIAATPPVAISKSDEELHTIFLLLAMALVYDGWSVDQTRPDLLAAYARAEPGRHFPDTAGHHVGALVVGADASIASFALNRNVALNSTLEHAEARAIRNAIGIANASTDGQPRERWSYSNILRGTRVYATLEPCVQCAGIMDLANVAAAIYGQDDPAQGHVLNVLYNLPRVQGKVAPLPIRASFAPYWSRLRQAFKDFQSEDSQRGGSGATFFLSTVAAYEIYRDAAQDFMTMTADFPENVVPLGAARAFRARWGRHIELGVAPY